jgi:hypothetical protein
MHIYVCVFVLCHVGATNAIISLRKVPDLCPSLIMLYPPLGFCTTAEDTVDYHPMRRDVTRLPIHYDMINLAI